MKYFLFCIFLLCSVQLSASPLLNLKKYGEGEMKVLFWDLYKAELYGSKPTYDANDKKLTLKITYYRDIDKEDLIDATKDQWDHIKYQHPNMDSWLAALADIWPDIKEGDTLIVTQNDQNGANFYDDKRKLGTIDDPDFGFAFLSIWLSEKTSRPKLRLALVGENK